MAESLLIEEPHPYNEDVAASVIIEPPAGGGVGGGSVGTLPAAAMQFADLTESGSESGDDVRDPQLPHQQQQHQQQTQQQSHQQQQLEHGSSGRSSPPPNCAICLSRCRRKCFTDSCMHQFCFKCLCEWSKIKAECPLCKQPFKTIIHNVRTLDDYDRYPVQSSPPEHSALSFHIVNIRRQRLLNPGVLANDIDAAATDDSLDGLLPQPTRMQGPFNRFEPYRTELLNFYRHDQDAGGSGSLSQLWRRYVYDRKLYALPVCDSLTGQFREWSARFYRDNPAQMHRLMPWINRDIVCLLRNLPQNVSEVMQLMHDILPMINIPTRTFRRRLTPYLGERTNHFIHELFNFARSPYDMVGYDRVVQYSARVAEEVEVDLLDLVPSSNEGSGAMVTDGGVGGGDGDANVIAEASSEWSRLPRPSTSVIVTNPSATHSFSVTMATDGSELPGISIRRTTTSNVGSQTVAINLSMRRPADEVIEIGDDGDAEANAEVAAINDGTGHSGRRQAGASLPISAHIELQSSDCSNSSDDDECVFVLERKPPHLRTPELVSLDSNSDSDVVFVDEQKPQKPATPPKTTSATDGERRLLDAAAASDAAADAAPASGTVPTELFMGPSTSTGVCSTSHSHWKVLEDARRKDLLQRNGIPKRHATRSQYRHSHLTATLGAAGGSSSSSGTNWTNSSSSTSSSSSEESNEKLRKRRPARKTKTRKRVARNDSSNKFKNKRRRKQKPTDEDENEDEKPRAKRRPRSSRSKSSNSNNSSSSGDEKSDAASNNVNEKRKRNVSSSSNDESNSSDDDSTDNLLLSTLREHIKIELKPHKPQLKAETEEPEAEAEPEADAEAEADGEAEKSIEQQHQTEALLNIKSSSRKRRRSCNSNSSQLSNLSSRSNSQSVNSSTLASQCNNTMSSCSPLSHTLTNNSDANAPSHMAAQYHGAALIELPGGDSVGGAGSGQSEATLSYMQNSVSNRHQRTVDEEAQLGIYSDGSNDDFIIDVGRDVESSLLNESVEEEPEEQQQQQDEQEQQQAEEVAQPRVAYVEEEEDEEDEDEEEEEEEQNDEDDDDDEEDENENEPEPEPDQEQEAAEDDNDATDDAEDSPAPDTEASDSE